MPSKIIPQKHRDIMVEDYLNGATAEEAAEPFGYSYQTCLRSVRMAGERVRTSGETKREYSVDERFFQVVDIEEKAYWLGFLSADGTITDTGHIKLTLSQKDYNHLHKFTSSLDSEHPIKTRNIYFNGEKYQVATVTVCSVKMVEDLKNLGITPRKSLTVSPPIRSIPEHLLRHYWRGVFDGDGNIYVNIDAWEFQVRLLGTQAVVNGFRSFLEANGVSSETQNRLRGNVIEGSFGGIALCKKILREIYADASIFLDRKMQDATLVMKQRRRHKDWSHITSQQLEELHESMGSWNDVAEFLGTDRGTLYKIRKRLDMPPDWNITRPRLERQ